MSTTTWNIDASHSEVGFKVRHLMLSNVKGQFSAFTASVVTEGDDLSTAKIHFEAQIASITTNNEQRDGHLKGADFFDAEQFPTLKFESTTVTKVGDHQFTVTGNLTIKETTKSVELNVLSTGLAKDPWGQTKTAFEISAKINRNDFGLIWNAPLETGGVLLSEDVYINAEAQFIQAQ
jgi:polyisoprenoid-binding protein YceI